HGAQSLHLGARAAAFAADTGEYFLGGLDLSLAGLQLGAEGGGGGALPVQRLPGGVGATGPLVERPGLDAGPVAPGRGLVALPCRVGGLVELLPGLLEGGLGVAQARPGLPQLLLGLLQLLRGRSPFGLRGVEGGLDLSLAGLQLGAEGGGGGALRVQLVTQTSSLGLPAQGSGSFFAG